MRRSTCAFASLVVALSVVVGLGSNAVATSCSVTNTRDGATFATLQEAVDASVAGDTLGVRGICVGPTLIEDTVLTIQGMPTTAQPIPTLEGGAIKPPWKGQSVLFVKRGPKVRILDLTIRYTAPFGSGIRNGGGLTLGGSTVVMGTEGSDGVGILNSRRLRLRGSSIVTENNGSGIRNTSGHIMLHGSSSVTGNRAEVYGGGIYNSGGTVTLNDSSSIAGNVAGDVGGGIYSTFNGTVTLNDSSSVSGNESGSGGGIVSAGGTVTLNDSSSVTRNKAGSGGGIVIQTGDSLTLNDSASVSGNVARLAGGGIGAGGAFRPGAVATITMNGSSSVTGNTAVAGGGVLLGEYSMLTMNDSSAVTGNTASGAGGIFLSDYTASVYICSDLVAISPNDPDDPPPTLPCP